MLWGKTWENKKDYVTGNKFKIKSLTSSNKGPKTL